MICQDKKERNFRISDSVLEDFTNRICAVTKDTTIFDIYGIIYDIYEMGNAGGQEFIWKIRSGDFETRTE